MRPIRYLPSADEDLLNIFLTIATDNEPAAHRLVDKIRTAVLRLKDHPLSAPSRAYIRPDLRGLSIGRYIVYYTVTPEEVLITRIMHMARDIDESDFSAS